MANEDLSGFAIGAVERDTGIGRDTLRIWERRYGFPSPVRNARGERVYPEEQVRRLQTIRRLLDQGMRPGQVVPLQEDALNALARETGKRGDGAVACSEAGDELLRLAGCADATGIGRVLEASLARDGLRGFVIETLAPLARAVGELWAEGRLEIYEEHLLTRQVTGFLDVAMSRLGRPAGAPQVLLATLPGEPHALGLQMAEALLWSRGTPTLNLGTEVPMDQLAEAAMRSGATTLALSFSGAYPYRSVRPDLEELRERIGPGLRIWVGGEAVRRLRNLPEGVQKRTLESL